MASPRKSFFPTRKETLAQKQQERVRRWRLEHLGNRWSRFSSRRWVKIGEIGGIGALFLVNLWLLWPFFGHEDLVNVFSAPVIPFLAAITERIVPFAYGVRVWLLLFLIFFPIVFYYFVREIAGRKLTALLAASIVILPIGFFLPVRVALGLWAEDGAHIASLTFSLIACLFLLKFLRQGHFWSGVLAALTAALVALISPLGLIILSSFMSGITFSEILLGQARLKLTRLLVIAVLTAGFSAFWYHPKFVILTLQSPQGQLMGTTFFNLLPISFFLVPILGVFGFLLFENRPQLQPMFIAFFLTVAFGIFSLGAGIAHTLPSRFLPAFGISLSFLIGVAAVWLFDFLRTSAELRRIPLILAYRRRIAFGLMGLVFSLVMATAVLIGQNFRQAQESPVLGSISKQKVGIWEIRQETSQLESIFGFTISGLTVVGVGVLRRKMGVRVRSEK